MKGKNVVLGVTGCISAYKACEIIRELKKQGAEVSVVMTENACKFVTSLTFQTLSQNQVFTQMFPEKVDWKPEHISLSETADCLLIAPASADLIGKVASGIADDLLSSVVMATKAPVIIAPSMNSNMYSNKIVQGNVAKLKGIGYKFIGPDYGYLACGYEGEGRLASIDKIMKCVKDELKKSKKKKSKR